jgi:inorganic pyrophosphatase
MDGPLGSKHSRFGFTFEANYGYIPNTKAPDGDELDAYYLGVGEPLERAKGKCIAIIHRFTDDDDKLVVVPEGVELSDQEIKDAVSYQEKWTGSKWKVVRE